MGDGVVGAGVGAAGFSLDNDTPITNDRQVKRKTMPVAADTSMFDIIRIIKNF